MKKTVCVILVIINIILLTGCVEKPKELYISPEFDEHKKEDVVALTIKNLTKIYENNQINVKKIINKEDIDRIINLIYDTKLFTTGPSEVNNVDRYTFVIEYKDGTKKSCVLVYDEKYKERFIIDKHSYNIETDKFKELQNIYSEMNYPEELTNIVGFLV